MTFMGMEDRLEARKQPAKPLRTYTVQPPNDKAPYDVRAHHIQFMSGHVVFLKEANGDHDLVLAVTSSRVESITEVAA